VSANDRPASESAGDGGEGRRHRQDRPAIAARLTVARRIAASAIRRNARKIPEQDVYLASLLVGMLGVLVVLPPLFLGTREAGAALADGDASAVSLAWHAAALGWLGMVAYGALLGVGSEGEPDQPALLAVRPAEDVVLGLAAVAGCWGALFALPPVAVAYAGLSIGLGSPLPLAGGLVAGLAVLASATAVGYPIGLAIKGSVRRSPWLERAKPLLAVGLALAYFTAIFTGAIGPLFAVLGPAVMASPVAWFGDLAMVTTPGAGASPLAAAGALAVAGLLVPAGLALGGRTASYAWYVDPVQPAGAEEAAEPSEDRLAVGPTLDRALAAVTPTRSMAGVAGVALRRAYREPIQLLFAAVPLLGAIPLFEQLLSTGAVPWWTPWAVVAYGAWVAGTTFPLNVLGVQGAVLPAVLVSRARGRDVVAGTVLGAAAVVAPVTALLAVGAGMAAGRSTTALAAVGIAGLVVVTAAAVLATGIGALAPRLEPLEISAERTAPLPSKTAYAAFSTALIAGVLGAATLAEPRVRLLIALLLERYLPTGWVPTPAQLETGAQLAVPLVLLAIPISFVVAAGRIDRYRLS